MKHDETEDAARSLFSFLDRNGDGTIDAQEMMDALMLLSDFESKNHDRSLTVTRPQVRIVTWFHFCYFRSILWYAFLPVPGDPCRSWADYP